MDAGLTLSSRIEMLRAHMATKTTQGDSLGVTTEFVLHKSQQEIFAGIQKKIIDYTEHRLIRYALSVVDPQQKMVVMALITDYRAGKVAIAWRKGQPTYVRVTHDS